MCGLLQMVTTHTIGRAYFRDGSIHRWDNAPDHPQIATFPKHFREGSSENVKESRISGDSEEAIVEILDFIKAKLKTRD